MEKLREAREAFSRRDFFGKGAKAVGAYTLFLREEFAKVPKGEHLEIADQSPRVAAAWNALSKHEQDQWYAKADKLRAAYNAQRYALEQSLSFEERLVHYYERVRRHMINNKLSLRTAGKRGEHGVASATTTLSGAPVVKALPRPYNLFIKDWFEKKREQKAAGVVETHHVEQFSAASEAWKRLSPVERQVYHDRAAALAAERAAEQ